MNKAGIIGSAGVLCILVASVSLVCLSGPPSGLKFCRGGNWDSGLSAIHRPLPPYIRDTYEKASICVIRRSYQDVIAEAAIELKEPGNDLLGSPTRTLFPGPKPGTDIEIIKGKSIFGSEEPDSYTTVLFFDRPLSPMQRIGLAFKGWFSH